MKIEFVQSIPKADLNEDVWVGGEKYGTMHTYTDRNGDYRHHACINLPGLSGSVGLIQGHGASKQQAILNAIASGREEATQVLQAIDRFEELLAEA